MDFLKDDPRKLYRQFLVSSMFSALVMSIYSFVDTIAVGQSEGRWVLRQWQSSRRFMASWSFWESCAVSEALS